VWMGKRREERVIEHRMVSIEWGTISAGSGCEFGIKSESGVIGRLAISESIANEADQ
jgi:hypothetical protein